MKDAAVAIESGPGGVLLSWDGLFIAAATKPQRVTAVPPCRAEKLGPERLVVDYNPGKNAAVIY